MKNAKYTKYTKYEKIKNANMKIYNMDADFFSQIYDILDCPDVQRMAEFKHHRHSTRLEHSLNVSYFSYKTAKKMGLDYKSAARGGLLHDFFLYNWSDLSKEERRSHVSDHPKMALINAKKYFDINEVEEDIILKHMFLASISPPKFKESLLVSFIDKHACLLEIMGRRMEKKAVTKTMIAQFALLSHKNTYTPLFI